MYLISVFRHPPPLLYVTCDIMVLKSCALYLELWCPVSVSVVSVENHSCRCLDMLHRSSSNFVNMKELASFSF